MGLLSKNFFSASAFVLEISISSGVFFAISANAQTSSFKPAPAKTTTLPAKKVTATIAKPQAAPPAAQPAAQTSAAQPSKILPQNSSVKRSISSLSDSDKALEVRGQARNLSMMLTLKNRKDAIDFVKPRETYSEEIKNTGF